MAEPLGVQVMYSRLSDDQKEKPDTLILDLF